MKAKKQFRLLFAIALVLPVFIICGGTTVSAQDCGFWSAYIFSVGTVRVVNDYRIPQSYQVSNVFVGPPLIDNSYNTEAYEKVRIYVSKTLGVPLELVIVHSASNRERAERNIELLVQSLPSSKLTGYVKVPNNCSGVVSETRSEPNPYVLGTTSPEAEAAEKRRVAEERERLEESNRVYDEQQERERKKTGVGRAEPDPDIDSSEAGQAQGRAKPRRTHRRRRP